MIERARVIATAAVTWLVAASAIVTAVAPQIGELFPNSAEDIAAWAARVVAVLGGAVVIIRRVTPVAADERGVLPVEAP